MDRLGRSKGQSQNYILSAILTLHTFLWPEYRPLEQPKLLNRLLVELLSPQSRPMSRSYQAHSQMTSWSQVYDLPPQAHSCNHQVYVQWFKSDNWSCEAKHRLSRSLALVMSFPSQLDSWMMAESRQIKVWLRRPDRTHNLKAACWKRPSRSILVLIG